MTPFFYLKYLYFLFKNYLLRTKLFKNINKIFFKIGSENFEN